MRPVRLKGRLPRAVERVAADDPEQQADRREQSVEDQRERSAAKSSSRSGRRGPSRRRRLGLRSRGGADRAARSAAPRPRERSPGCDDPGRTTPRPPGAPKQASQSPANWRRVFVRGIELNVGPTHGRPRFLGRRCAASPARQPRRRRSVELELGQVLLPGRFSGLPMPWHPWSGRCPRAPARPCRWPGSSDRRPRACRRSARRAR